MTASRLLTPGRVTALLWVVWTLAMTLSGLAAGIFIAGVMRDARAGEPTVGLSLDTQTGWVETPFRVWRAGRYRLFISSVNHDPARVGTPFEGDLEIEVRRPDGTVLFAERYANGALGHSLPDNYGDTELAILRLDASRISRWRVAVRVARGDTRFAGIRSELKLWREPYDPGMGLVSYVMIVPAAVFFAVALAAGLGLARRGSSAPLVIPLAGAIAFLIWMNS